MAQGNSQDVDKTKNFVDKNMECPVCLQSCIHPARLPCGHIFCFLCVKGVANQSKCCALCRSEIPLDFLDHPYLVPSYEEAEIVHEGYQWFYEGRNGWWQYDERTSTELEASFIKNEKNCEMLIAGFLYLIDFEAMMQIRRNDPRRKRQIKRDISTIPKKGIAGIRIEGCSNVNSALPSQIQNIEASMHELQNSNRLDRFPEPEDTNIAYQHLEQSNVSEEVPGLSDVSDDERDNNTNSVMRSPIESTNLNHDPLEIHDFDTFVLNRIRTLNIGDGGESESD